MTIKIGTQTSEIKSFTFSERDKMLNVFMLGDYVDLDFTGSKLVEVIDNDKTVFSKTATFENQVYGLGVDLMNAQNTLFLKTE